MGDISRVYMAMMEKHAATDGVNRPVPGKGKGKPNLGPESSSDAFNAVVTRADDNRRFSQQVANAGKIDKADEQAAGIGAAGPGGAVSVAEQAARKRTADSTYNRMAESAGKRYGWVEGLSDAANERRMRKGLQNTAPTMKDIYAGSGIVGKLFKTVNPLSYTRLAKAKRDFARQQRLFESGMRAAARRRDEKLSGKLAVDYDPTAIPIEGYANISVKGKDGNVSTRPVSLVDQEGNLTYAGVRELGRRQTSNLVAALNARLSPEHQLRTGSRALAQLEDAMRAIGTTNRASGVQGRAGLDALLASGAFKDLRRRLKASGLSDVDVNDLFTRIGLTTVY